MATRAARSNVGVGWSGKEGVPRSHTASTNSTLREETTTLSARNGRKPFQFERRTLPMGPHLIIGGRPAKTVHAPYA